MASRASRFQSNSLGKSLFAHLEAMRGLVHSAASRRHDLGDVSAAIEALADELSTVFVGARARRGRQFVDPRVTVKRLRNQLSWQRSLKRKAEAALKKEQLGKEKAHKNRLSATTLAKVALARPSAAVRSFAAAWQDIVDDDGSRFGCSRGSITAIRNAFAEVVIERSREDVQAAVRAVAAEALDSAAAQRAGGHVARTVVCVPLLHIHDEASMRLRSRGDPSSGGPARSRSSKVQLHFVRACPKAEQAVSVATELDALANKSARVLATSLLRVLTSAASDVAQGIPAASRGVADAWLVHVLVGDGIATNFAAARIVLEQVRRRPLDGLRYFVFALRCAAHQANLSIAAGVSGRAAATSASTTEAMCAGTADRDSADGPHAAHRQVCGAIVRCFKYLINDYHVEFTGSLLALVQRLHISAGRPDAATTRRWRGMEALYGSGVFPEGLLDVLNMGASRWEHRVPAGAPAGAAEAARGRLGDLLRKKLLQVDEHPTLSRMFTFRGHVDTLLLFVLLGKQEDVLRVQAVQPRERNRNRLRKVLAFLREEATPQYLRRASLSLGVLDHVQRWLEARATHSVDGCTTRRKSEHGCGDPLLVRLGKGELDGGAG